VIPVKKMKILTGAGAWGYGPCATLRLLLREIGVFAEVDFVGESVALDFALRHKTQFHRVFDSYPTIQENYDLVISVMEPDILLWAYKQDIPSVSIDNLYWMWEWEEPLLQSSVSVIDKEESFGEIRNKLQHFGEYFDYSVMYTLAQKVFLQKFDQGLPASLEGFADKIQFVDPMVDLSYRKALPHRNTILISFSGMINPYVTELDLIVYLFVVRSILREGLDRYGTGHEMVYAVHESLADTVKKVFRTENVYALTHPEFLQRLDDCLLVIAPAGMATMFECLAYEVPLLVLPEQHDGNYTNYMTLYRNGVSDAADWEAFPELMLSTRVPEARQFKIEDFYRRYMDELTGAASTLLRELSALAGKTLGEIATADASRDFARAQTAKLSHVVGEFKGVQQIAEAIKGLVQMSGF